jgi:hypothetical protein
MLGVTCVNQKHLNATLVEQFEDRNPIDSGRFHDDCLNPAFREPIGQPMQIGCKGAEAAHWLGCAIRTHRRDVHRRPDIDSRPRSDEP